MAKRNMIDILIDYSFIIVTFGAIISLIGAVFTKLNDDKTNKMTDAQLSKNNDVAIANSRLSENIKDATAKNNALTTQILILTEKVQELSENNLKITEDIEDITRFSRDYVSGKGSYCKIIHLVKGDTAFFYLSNAKEHPIRDIDGKLSYEEFGDKKEPLISFPVLYPDLRKSLTSVKLDTNKIFKLEMTVHSNAGYQTQLLYLAFTGGGWKRAIAIQNKAMEVVEGHVDRNFPINLIYSNSIDWSQYLDKHY